MRFHEIQFLTDAESFSFLSGKTKKFYSYKKHAKIDILDGLTLNSGINIGIRLFMFGLFSRGYFP